ncbi:MAG: D-2-hydroxyacid dehydrogenase [Acidobacteria bacterium]|nr:D-2-hydroxyacid dehydrogenase [Acidobacteriota bacterium]
MEPVNVVVTLRKDTTGAGLNWAFREEHLERIRAVSPRLDVRWTPCLSVAEMAPVLGGAEVLHTMYGAFPLEAAPRLKWVHVNTASLDRLAGQPILQSGVIITNNSGVYDVNVAEHCLALMLAWVRRLPQFFRWQQERYWPDRDELRGMNTGATKTAEQCLPETSALRMTEIHGATVGIVGYGSIGRQLASLLTPFRARILAMKRNPDRKHDAGFTSSPAGDPRGELPAAWFHPSQMREMFAQCDFVVLCQPSTPETLGSIGEPELRSLPPHAFLVNVGRGATVDDAALRRALSEGWIAGAGLDVFATEPLPPDSPWFDTPNVIATPHLAGASGRSQDRAAVLFCQNLQRYLNGEPLLNVIDKNLRY